MKMRVKAIVLGVARALGLGAIALALCGFLFTPVVPLPVGNVVAPTLLWQFCGPSAGDVVGDCNTIGSVSTTARSVPATAVSKFIAGASTPIANQPSGAAHIQITFNALSSGLTQLNDVWIGSGEDGSHSGACGSYTSVGFCSWNFNATPTQITFNGGSPNVSSSGRFTSDSIAYTMNPALPTLVAFGVVGSASSEQSYELPVGTPNIIATPNPNTLPSPFNTYIMTRTIMTATLSSTVCGAGFLLNVTAVSQGKLVPGQLVSGTSIPAGLFILSNGTGTGNTGTYCVNQNLTVSSEAMAATEAGVTFKASGTTSQNNGIAYALASPGGSGAISFIHSIVAVP